MRLPAFLPLFLATVTLTLTAAAQTTADVSQREIALDKLLSERGPAAALDQVIAEARKTGVSEQAILEARFLYHIDRSEDEAIAALLPNFIKLRDTFQVEQSAIFGVKEDWLAVTEYVSAIAALMKDDKAGFKTHITEAFWLSPRQASAFAPHIERLRLEESMRSVKINFETRLRTLHGGEAVALKSLMAGKKAMLLHFWSPANRECLASMPDYAATAAALTGHGIAMVSILPDDSPPILTEARAAILPLGPVPPGAWLLDHPQSPLARELRVLDLPLFVLLASDGSVLFNGEPFDKALWEALKKIEPQISRPGAPPSEQ